MAGFEPRKDYQAQKPAPAGAGVPLSQNPLVQTVGNALSQQPQGGQLGAYAPQQLPPAGLPLGASAGGNPLPTPKPPVQPVVDAALKVSGAGAASSAVPPAAPTPAAQGAKPQPMMTQPEQAAAGIQQRSQSTPAANIGTAPGKQPAAGGFGVAKMGNQEYRINGGNAEKFVGGVSQGDPAKASFTGEEQERGRVADAQRNQQTLADNARFRADTSYEAGVLKAGEYRDPMQRAMMMKSAADQYGVAAQGLMTPEKQAQLGIQKQQADAQTTNAGANVKSADAAMVTAQRGPLKKTTTSAEKFDTGDRNRKTGQPFPAELQVTRNEDGSLTPASEQQITAFLQSQAQGKIQAEQDNRGFFSSLFSSGLTPEEIQAQAAEQAKVLGARYGVGGSNVQAPAQIDPSQIVMVNGIPHKRAE